MGPGIFDEITINKVTFKNRLLRSSVGGRMSNYDGTVTDVWKNFESRFAAGGVGAIISTTFNVTAARLAPFQYPSIADARYVPYLRKYIAAIREPHGCRYIVQIGDPGYVTQTSLFPEAADAKSSSSGFDFAFGYNNLRTEMTDAEVRTTIGEFVDAARRVRDAGADGVEITITKGYLLHQFLNPGLNRRRDQWGGDADGRFRIVGEIVSRVRDAVGADFLVGVRMSYADYNYVPLLFLLARDPGRVGRGHWIGNDEEQMLDYAQRLDRLGVDYLHVVSGTGFPSPRDTPGAFPFEELKLFFNSNRHLSFKAAVRSTLCNTVPTKLGSWVGNLGWRRAPGLNLEGARRIRAAVRRARVIVNGGFQERDGIAQALQGVDMVSMARALIANPDLPLRYAADESLVAKECSYCNRCIGRTATGPLGCYDEERFDQDDGIAQRRRRMVEKIMEYNQPDPA